MASVCECGPYTVVQLETKNSFPRICEGSTALLWVIVATDRYPDNKQIII